MPAEMTTAIDIYSYGMLLWEMWHDQIPFENNLQMATHYVLQEKSRPKLIHSANDLKEEKDNNLMGSSFDNTEEKMTFCDSTVSSIIRKCWA